MFTIDKECLSEGFRTLNFKFFSSVSTSPSSLLLTRTHCVVRCFYDCDFNLNNLPLQIMLLVSLFGAGVQLFGMSIWTIIVAMLGMLSPSSRGSLLNASFALYVIMGSVMFISTCVEYLRLLKPLRKYAEVKLRQSKIKLRFIKPYFEAVASSNLV